MEGVVLKRLTMYREPLIEILSLWKDHGLP